MRRRILAAILGTTALAILLFGLPLAFVAERFVDQEATLRLERQAILAAHEVPGDFATGNDPVELPAGTDAASLALYGTDGARVTGGGPASADPDTRSALANRVSDTETGGVRIVAVPVTADERVIGAIRAEQPTAASDMATWRVLGLLAALAVAVFAVGTLVAVVVARRLARPVRHLTDAVVALGNGAFDVEMAPVGIGEIDSASRAVTATANRLDTLLRRERAFSADASHQLRTPLAGLRAAIETELEFPREDAAAVLRESIEDIDRLERTIEELLCVARSDQSSEAEVDIAGVVEDLRAAWHGPLAAAGRPLRIHVDDDLPPARGNPVLLRHALDVVLDNALVHGAGTVTVSAAVADTSVTLSVSDEGPGFSATNAARPPAEPHGMGLDLAGRLLARMAARLVISDRRRHPRIDIVMARVGPGLMPGPTPR